MCKPRSRDPLAADCPVRTRPRPGFLNDLAGGRIEVRSAGSIPGDQVNPSAIEAM
jgi:arsenate reductase